MDYNGQHLDFPGIAQVSFCKLFDALEEQASDPDKHVADHAKALLKELEPYPELRDGFEDMTLLETLKPQIDKLLRPIFPDALQHNEIKGTTAPMSFDIFHYSKRFQSIRDAAGADWKVELRGFDPDQFYIMGCAMVLAMHYGYFQDSGVPFVIEVPDNKSDMMRTYRIAFNADMIEVLPTKSSVPISEADYRMLIDNYDDIELWKTKFPPRSWIFRGFGIVNLTDVTADTALASIATSLLNKETATPQRMQQNMRNLFGIPELDLGFVAYEEGMFWITHKGGNDSMLLGEHEQMVAKDAMCKEAYEILFTQRKALVVPDVDAFHKSNKSFLTTNVRKRKVKSYLCVPLSYEGDPLGFIEIGSPHKYQLNGGSLAKLDSLLPILNMAVSRFKEEAKNLMEAIIQQECTTIHPAVKWRFEDEARAYMVDKQSGNQPQFNDIVFRDVYPLYGQTDIKGSSSQRNEAVKADLLTQTTAVRSILATALDRTHLPVLEELMHRVDNYVNEIEEGLLAGSEHMILSFLRSEIYPVFNHLQELDKKLAQLIDDYSHMLDPDLHVVYEARKRFDHSVTQTNQTLANFIDRKQLEAQAMFPHYFERYKTDGVEYNMYIGQSLVRNRNYHHMYLSNLRVWQLLVMCEMENEFNVLRQKLDTPLEVASLILVYNTPLSIHFRMDEKRFDVEGAYNARYEIVKKRVDKAHIKGTDERITQPGKLAIIYTSAEDRQEYERYLHFLEAKGYIEQDGIEDLALEDLQGITGLRALRVAIAYPESGLPATHSYEELIATLEP